MANSNSSNNGDSLDLHRRIENLPQELYDRIYDLTFTATPKVRLYNSCADAYKRLKLDYLIEISARNLNICINEKPPHLLHVDRRSREKFARSYFGHPGSIFVFYGNSVNNTYIQSSHFGLIPIPRSSFKQGWGSMPAEVKAEMMDEGWTSTTLEKFEFLNPWDVTYLLVDLQLEEKLPKRSSLIGQGHCGSKR